MKDEESALFILVLRLPFPPPFSQPSHNGDDFFSQLPLALPQNHVKITKQFAHFIIPVGLMEAIMISHFRRHKAFPRQIHSHRSRRPAFLRVEELESRFLFSAGGLDSIFA